MFVNTDVRNGRVNHATKLKWWIALTVVVVVAAIAIGLAVSSSNAPSTHVHDDVQHFKHDHVRRGARRRAELHLPVPGMPVLLGRDTSQFQEMTYRPALLVRYARLQRGRLQPLAGQAARLFATATGPSPLT